MFKPMHFPEGLAFPDSREDRGPASADSLCIVWRRISRRASGFKLLPKPLALQCIAALFVWMATCGVIPLQAQATLINLSYEPTREFFADVNREFSKAWRAASGRDILVLTSHGGSGKQARTVIDGADADVVCLALGYDIDVIASQGRLLPRNWQERFPNHSTPFASTIVFVVRTGNPRRIGDWQDLARPGVNVVTPNPKSSGGARWNFVAAYGWALRRPGATPESAREYLTQLYGNVEILDSGARAATVTFSEKGVGDVLIAWENEAMALLEGRGKGRFEIVLPTESILAEPPVAIVDKVASRRGTTEAARAYIEFLYSETGQNLALRHHFRPIAPSLRTSPASPLPAPRFFTLRDVAGDWGKAHREYFVDGGLFDQVMDAARENQARKPKAAR